jgi:hypothetical protein
VIAGRHFADSGTHGFDDAGAFVAEHRRQLKRSAAGKCQVGMAEADTGDADQDFIVSRRVDCQGFYRKGVCFGSRDRGFDFHDMLLLREI